MRLLLLRPERRLFPGLDGRDIFFDEARQKSVSRFLADNYLVPPADTASAAAASSSSHGGSPSIAEAIQRPGYFLHPVTRAPFRPRIVVQGKEVDWSLNPLLAHLNFGNSGVLTLPHDQLRYGSTMAGAAEGVTASPAARLVITYLGRDNAERYGVIFFGTVLHASTPILKNNFCWEDIALLCRIGCSLVVSSVLLYLSAFL